MTTFKKYIFPGLTNPVYLPDWIPVEIKIIPSSVAGWTSGQKVPVTQFTSTTWHDTGNQSSNANGEYNWANSGGRASINSPGSYNGIFDGTKVIITQRFDELVGHAANHTGNVTSYAFEQAGWGPAYDFDKSLDVGEWLHAGVLHAIGKTAKEAMFQHNYWSGKDCPGEIRRRGLWSKVEDTVDAGIDEIAAFVQGGASAKPTEPTVTYEPASPVAALKDERPFLQTEGGAVFVRADVVVEATKQTPRLKYAGGTAKVGPDINQGERFLTDYIIVNNDGSLYWYTPYGTRVRYDDTKVIATE
jgi:hypothetical protein